MNEAFRYLLGAFFAGPYSSVFPLLVVPPIACALVYAAMRCVRNRSLNPKSQMLVGGIAACIPGLVTLALLDFSIHYIPRIKPEEFGCYVKVYGPLSIVLLLSLRSVGLLYLRGRQLAKLYGLAVQPSDRLAQVGRDLGICIYEVPVRTFICMVAGWSRPRVLVSTGTLQSFSNDELHAALLHERAHLRRGDTRWSVIIHFLSNLGVWPVNTALAVYRQGRESLADREAASSVGGPAFASVLVRFAKDAVPIPFAEALVERDSLDQRVRRLLDGSTERLGWISRIAMGLALGSAGILTLYAQWARGVANTLFRCTL
jgi:hypothetical protein